MMDMREWNLEPAAAVLTKPANCPPWKVSALAYSTEDNNTPCINIVLPFHHISIHSVGKALHVKVHQQVSMTLVLTSIGCWLLFDDYG